MRFEAELAKDGFKLSTPILMKAYAALIVLLIHAYIGMAFFFVERGGGPPGFPERWNQQFLGLLIVSACLTLVMYGFSAKWLTALAFTLRTIIAILILAAMPQKMLLFSWLLNGLLFEAFLFLSWQWGSVVGCLLLAVVTLLRFLTNYTWDYYHHSPRAPEIINLWIQSGAVMLAGSLLGIMQDRLRRILSRSEDYRQSNLDLVETNLRLQEYSFRTKQESIINERNRISREIHDSVGYILTNLIVTLDLAGELVGRNQAMAQEKLDNGREQAKLALSEVRRAVRALRPPVEVNRLQAVSELVAAFTQATGVAVTYHTEIPERLGEAHERLIYRVIQEALTNSFRHGQADQVLINLRLKSQRLSLTICDNGVGVEEINLGCGLTGIRERVETLSGSLHIDSSPEKGFILKIFMPWNATTALRD